MKWYEKMDIDLRINIINVKWKFTTNTTEIIQRSPQHAQVATKRRILNNTKKICNYLFMQ